jgi:hypothetical protein
MPGFTPGIHVFLFDRRANQIGNRETGSRRRDATRSADRCLTISIAIVLAPEVVGVYKRLRARTGRDTDGAGNARRLQRIIVGEPSAPIQPFFLDLVASV